MFLKRTPNKSGRIHLSIVEKYYDKATKSSRQHTLETLGYLDELEKEHEDPIAFYSQRVAQMNKVKEQEQTPISFDFFHSDKIDLGIRLRKNFGYMVLSKIYHQLGIHTFFINRQRHSKEFYDANGIMKLLVFLRLLDPASKKGAFENREWLFDKFDFSLDDVYRCLSFFHKHRDALLLRIHQGIGDLYGRDTQLVYYDVTNYYFEIDGPEGFKRKKKTDPLRVPDGFRKKGVSKEHRPDPIIQMGLFIDKEGIPITYRLFSGNTNDCLTYRPLLSQIKRQFGLARSVVVADKGVSTGDNTWYTLSAQDGYIFSLSVRKANKELKSYVLNEEGYTWIGDDFKYKRKSRLYPRTIQVTMTSGKKENKVVDEKQVVFYSDKYAKRARAEREAVVTKAKDLIAHPSKYTRATSYGASKYVRNISFDKKTGEILNPQKKLMLDEKQLKADEEMDGYYVLVTSEYTEDDDKIIELYHGLWKIEETFCVTKSELETRPIYVSRQEHIEAHFLTCFISLVIIRVLEMLAHHKYSAGRILESLRQAQCTYLKQNYYLFDYCDDILNDIGSIYNIDFTKRIRTLNEIKNVLASTKK